MVNKTCYYVACVESDFIASVSCNVAAKSVMVLENKRIQHPKYSSQVTCFIQFVSLARPSLAIAGEGLASETMIQCGWPSW